MDKTPKIVFEKLPVYAVIAALIDLYDSGADFVDILRTESDNKHHLGLAVRPEYLNPDVSEENFSENIDNIRDNPDNILSRNFVEVEYKENEDNDDIYKDINNETDDNINNTNNMEDLNDIINGSI